MRTFNKIGAVLLSVIILLGLTVGVSQSPLLIKADAAMQINNGTKITRYSLKSTDSSKSGTVIKGVISGKFKYSSVTGSGDIIKNRSFIYNSRNNVTTVTINLNLKPFVNKTAYINGTVTNKGVSSNFSFSIYNHLSYDGGTQTFGKGYLWDSVAFYWDKNGAYGYASSVVSSNTNVASIKNCGDGTRYDIRANNIGSATLTVKYNDIGVKESIKVNVVQGKVYKSKKTIKVNEVWTNTANFDIRKVSTSFCAVAEVDQDFGKGLKTYKVRGLKRGTSLITIYYTNGNRSEITVTVK